MISDISFGNLFDGKATFKLVGRLLLPLAIAKGIIFASVYITWHGSPNFAQEMSLAWDGTNYQTISKSGYPQSTPSNVSYLYAFSPFYPLLIRALASIIGSYWISALVISNLFGFIFPIVILFLFDLKTALLAELFPSFLVYSTVAYSDSIALVFIALAFFFVSKDDYLLSGLCFALALFDLYSVAIIAPLFLFHVSRRKGNSSLITALKRAVAFSTPVVVAALSIVFFYILDTYNAFTYFSLEQSIWGVNVVSPVGQAMWLLNTNGQGWFTRQNWGVLGIPLTPSYWLVVNILFEAFMFAGAYLLARSKHPKKWFFVACSLAILFPLLFVEGTPAVSIPRLVLPAFPIFYGYSSSRLGGGRLLLIAYSIACVGVAIWGVLAFIFAFFA